MKNRRSFFASSFIGCLALGALAAGCASSGGAGKGQPPGPVEMDGTVWKMTTNNGTFDGQTVKFEKKGNMIVASWTDVGRLLRNNTAAHPGVWVFELFLPPVSENTYRGIYRPAGGMESEATFSVSGDGELLRCSLMESNWFRQR